MNYLVGDSIGMVHLIASCLSLIFGTMILFMEKGTKRHVKVGYLYVINMAILIVTAFMIYRLFNGWGVFHYLTVLSLFTILMGMVPIWLKKPVKRWKYFHYAFMYWSVMGLYAAFVAEMITRIPETPALV